MKISETVHGWGINDVDYNVTQTHRANGRKVIQMCNYYKDWRSMIGRCYYNKHQIRRPSYIGCTVCEEWKYFSNFIKWVDSQPNKDWKNCCLDKDLLVTDNKVYCPSICVYIPANINTFLNTKKASRGELMLGVSIRKGYSTSKTYVYRAVCNNPINPELSRNIGSFPTELEAHKAWQAKKHEYACQLADLQDDPRVAKALRERYAPDKDWTDK